MVRTLKWMTPTSKVKNHGHQIKKRYFMSHLTILQVIFEVTWVNIKGQRSTWKVEVKGQGDQVKHVISGFIWLSVDLGFRSVRVSCVSILCTAELWIY